MGSRLFSAKIWVIGIALLLATAAMRPAVAAPLTVAPETRAVIDCLIGAYRSLLARSKLDPRFTPDWHLYNQDFSPDHRADLVPIQRAIWVGPDGFLPKGYYADTSQPDGNFGLLGYSKEQARLLADLGMLSTLPAYLKHVYPADLPTEDVLDIFFRGYLEKRDNTVQVVQFSPKPVIYRPGDFSPAFAAAGHDEPFWAPEISASSRYVFQNLLGHHTTLPFVGDVEGPNLIPGGLSAEELLKQHYHAVEDTRYFMANNLPPEERAAFQLDKARVITEYMKQTQAKKMLLIMTALDEPHENLIGGKYRARLLGRFNLKNGQGQAAVYEIDAAKFIENRAENADDAIRKVELKKRSPLDPETAPQMDQRIFYQRQIDDQHLLTFRLVHRDQTLKLVAELDDREGNKLADGTAHFAYEMKYFGANPLSSQAGLDAAFWNQFSRAFRDKMAGRQWVEIHLTAEFADPRFRKLEVRPAQGIFNGNITFRSSNHLDLNASNPQAAYRFARPQDPEWTFGSPLPAIRLKVTDDEGKGAVGKSEEVTVPVRDELVLQLPNVRTTSDTRLFFDAMNRRPGTIWINGVAQPLPQQSIGQQDSGTRGGPYPARMAVWHSGLRPDAFLSGGTPYPLLMNWDDLRGDYSSNWGQRGTTEGLVDPPVRNTPQWIRVLKLQLGDIDWRTLFETLRNSSP